MASLRFSTILAARNDNTPGTGGYSYHHILPWRYYFMAGQIMARYAKLRVLFHGQTFGSSALQGRLASVAEKYTDRSGKPVGKIIVREFGSEFEAFLNEVAAFNLSSKQAIDLCAKLHGDNIVAGWRDPPQHGNFNPDAGNSIRTLIHQTADFDLDQIGNHCGAPPFGGFLGPAPEKRSDDLGSLPEPVRPPSCDAGQWSLLGLLRTVIESCCPQIASATAGQSLSITIKSDDFILLAGYLTKLTSHYNAAPVPFAPADWAVNGKSWIWVDPSMRDQKGTGIGAIFSISTTTESGGVRMRHDELPPGDKRARLFNPESGNRKIFQFVRS